MPMKKARRRQSGPIASSDLWPSSSRWRWSPARPRSALCSARCCPGATRAIDPACRNGTALLGGAPPLLPQRTTPRKATMSKLHLVFGGRVSDPQGLDFVDLSNLDVVGLFPNYKAAEKAWRAAAQRTVDDAEMKYVVVHLHKLLQDRKSTRRNSSH